MAHTQDGDEISSPRRESIRLLRRRADRLAKSPRYYRNRTILPRPEGERTAIFPPSRQRRHRLLALMLDPQRDRHQREPRGRGIKGYSPGEITSAHFFAFLFSRRSRRAPPASRLRSHWRTAATREGWARPQVRHLLGHRPSNRRAIRDYDNKLLRLCQYTTTRYFRARESQLHWKKFSRQLAESQKLDALGQLTGGVAQSLQ